MLLHFCDPRVLDWIADVLPGYHFASCSAEDVLLSPGFREGLFLSSSSRFFLVLWVTGFFGNALEKNLLRTEKSGL